MIRTRGGGGQTPRFSTNSPFWMIRFPSNSRKAYPVMGDDRSINPPPLFSENPLANNGADAFSERRQAWSLIRLLYQCYIFNWQTYQAEYRSLSFLTVTLCHGIGPLTPLVHPAPFEGTQRLVFRGKKQTGENWVSDQTWNEKIFGTLLVVGHSLSL